ncbi:hypothetical protein HK102_012412 [Quaeritorhiza haematococci]|nr:hypothetical protein HK102_012412 [Quaeritorhiza haematococci]
MRLDYITLPAKAEPSVSPTPSIFPAHAQPLPKPAAHPPTSISTSRRSLWPCAASRFLASSLSGEELKRLHQEYYDGVAGQDNKGKRARAIVAKHIFDGKGPEELLQRKVQRKAIIPTKELEDYVGWRGSRKDYVEAILRRWHLGNYVSKREYRDGFAQEVIPDMEREQDEIDALLESLDRKHGRGMKTPVMIQDRHGIPKFLKSETENMDMLGSYTTAQEEEDLRRATAASLNEEHVHKAENMEMLESDMTEQEKEDLQRATAASLNEEDEQTDNILDQMANEEGLFANDAIQDLSAASRDLRLERHADKPLINDALPVYLGQTPEYANQTRELNSTRQRDVIIHKHKKMTPREFAKSPFRRFFEPSRDGIGYVPIKIKINNTWYIVLQIDHIVPKRWGGVDHPRNYVAMHISMNTSFQDVLPEAKMAYIETGIVTHSSGPVRSRSHVLRHVANFLQGLRNDPAVRRAREDYYENRMPKLNYNLSSF